MDYEKKYKEALEWMRDAYPTLTGAAKEDAEHYFPELAESEDERIRKELINFLRSPFIKENLTDEKVAPWINYLENQQSSDWSEEDKENLNDVIAIVRDKYDDTIYGVRLENFLKSLPEKFNLQSKQEWSKEDEKKLEDVLYWFEIFCYKNQSKPEMQESLNWLKSLHPQSYWKPSEEQMGSLRLAIDSAKKAPMNATADSLNEIYEQLKKL